MRQQQVALAQAVKVVCLEHPCRWARWVVPAAPAETLELEAAHEQAGSHLAEVLVVDRFPA